MRFRDRDRLGLLSCVPDNLRGEFVNMSIRAIAHRGNPARFPENTLSSFRSACQLGASDLELDAQLSNDGVPVVFHDFTVNRMTDGAGTIKQHLLSDLKRLTVGENEEIPTLEEALLLLKGRLRIHLELKQMADLYPGLEEKTLELVHRLDMADQVIITSFDHDSLVRVRQMDKEIPLGLIVGHSSPAFLPFIKELAACSLEMKHTWITEPYIKWCEENAVQLAAWTVNEAEDMRKMLGLPSILVCTDKLESWIQLSRGAGAVGK